MTSQKILYATDYSEASENALQYASWLAKCTGSLLLIAHASEHEQYPVGELFNEEPKPPAEVREKLEAVVPEDPDVTCEHHLLFGEPGSVEIPRTSRIIVDFAREQDVDMIVIGTHGRTGLRRLVMGSIAEAIVRHADCPVVSIRQAKVANSHRAT